MQVFFANSNHVNGANYALRFFRPQKSSQILRPFQALTHFSCKKMPHHKRTNQFFLDKIKNIKYNEKFVAQ
jgi:hypothetical protein